MTRKILAGFFLVATMFVNTACPSKGGGGGGATNVPPVPPCVGSCAQGNGTAIAQGLGRYYDMNGVDQMQIGLFFSQTQATGAAGQNYYSGQAVATGTLTFRTQVSSVSCPIPAGTYSVVTVTPANWNAYSFWDLRLEATGPARLLIRLPNNFIKAAVPPVVGVDGITYPYKIQNTMVVESLNGYACNAFLSSFVLE